MMEFAKEIIVPTSFDPNPDVPGNHKALRRIFQGAVGALDDTLVHAVIPNDQQTCYRGRGRGECYQNVLGICDFNMIFTFVWAGWEGVAHDSRILTEVAFDPDAGFPFPPPNKYYLCDAAYTNTRGFMTPFRNTRMEKIDDTLFAEYDNATSSDDEEEENRNEGQVGVFHFGIGREIGRLIYVLLSSKEC
ncbi:hypothetical protein AgCh_033957 [Apium graveolens]